MAFYYNYMGILLPHGPFTAGAYPGFCSIKRLGIFLLAPEWDASPLLGILLALHVCSWYTFIQLGKVRTMRVSFPRTQHCDPDWSPDCLLPDPGH